MDETIARIKQDVAQKGIMFFDEGQAVRACGTRPGSSLIHQTLLVISATRRSERYS